LGLAQIDDDREFHIMEQFAFDTIKAFFDARGPLGETIAFMQSVADLDQVISHFQAATTGKGDIFEDVVFHTLAFCKGKTVADLPFVQLGRNQAAKKRWTKVKMNVGHVVRTSPQPDDATFLVQSPPGTLFSPSKVHRSDGLSLFASGECLSVGCKLYSKPVPSKDALSQFRSTDPKAAYELADEESPNQGAISVRAKWEEYRLHEKVALRLHVTIPRAQLPGDPRNHIRVRPGTTVLPDQSLVINIDVSNLATLFSVIKENAIRRAIYRLLYRITRSPELFELMNQ